MLSFKHAERCAIRNCRIVHAGSYGIELTDGCSEIEILGNTIKDLAGGGVKVWHTCRRTTIADNEIADGGWRFHQAVGVLIGKSSGNKVLHNHIHHFFYTGISIGWTWGYAENEACGNVVEFNHVHHIGQGMLSDMGGIYTLGVSPGTRIRYNVFHDVESRGYGGWAIYTDEGSTDILIENNLAYRTKSAVFHQHYGKNNVVRNNIFAFGREAQITRSRIEEHSSFVFNHNIVYYDTGVLFNGDWREAAASLDRNLYFDASKRPVTFAGRSLKAWRKLSLDKHSLIADPLFRNPARDDFTLMPQSPALALGFALFDLSTAGPRRKPEQRAGPMKTLFVRHWLLSRALPSAGKLDTLAFPKSRAALRFKPRVFPDILCDLHTDLFADKTRDVLVYAACAFSCSEPMKLALCLGYDGPVTVWVDGKMVFHNPDGINPCTMDKAVISCVGSVGSHEVLIAMASNFGRAWGIMLRLWRRDVPRRAIIAGSAGLSLPIV